MTESRTESGSESSSGAGGAETAAGAAEPRERPSTSDDEGRASGTPEDADDEGRRSKDEESGDQEPDEVRRLRSELDELNDRHLRLAAEFDNFRRRSQTQMGQSGIRAQAALVEKLLDVLDDFERFSSLDPEQIDVEGVLEGVELVEKKLRRVLEDAGLEAIEPSGERFDPNSMEAMLREPTDSEKQDDTVSQVLQKGFRFRGQLVRPARVSVRKYDD